MRNAFFSWKIPFKNFIFIDGETRNFDKADRSRNQRETQRKVVAPIISFLLLKVFVYHLCLRKFYQGKMALNYQKALTILKKWPVNPVKGNCDFGLYLRQRIQQALPDGEIFPGGPVWCSFFISAVGKGS